MHEPEQLPIVAHIRSVKESIEAYVDSLQGPFRVYFTEDVRNSSLSYISIAEVDGEGRRGDTLYHVRPEYGSNAPKCWKICDPEDGERFHVRTDLSIQEAGQTLARLLRQEDSFRDFQF